MYVLVTALSVMYPQPRSTVVRLLNMVPLRWVIITELITGAPSAIQSYCKNSVCVCTSTCVSFIPRQGFFVVFFFTCLAAKLASQRMVIMWLISGVS